MSLFVSVGFVEVFGRTVNRPADFVWMFILGISLLVALISPMASVYLALNRIFKPQEKRRHVLLILFSYFSLIICFGGSYYAMSAFGDRVDARAKYEYYEQKADYTDPFGTIVVRQDSRAFSGISTRLWSGVDWPDYKYNQLRDEQRSPVSTGDMLRVAERPFAKISSFQYDARFSVLASTLYFSTVNMTTLGFGDIAPTSWYTRLTSNIQVVTGLILTYFGISMVIGNWWKDGADS